MKPILLLTDYAFWGVIALTVLYAGWVRLDVSLRRNWRGVFESRAGGSAAIVLGVYFAIACFDSVRFEIRGETLSALDIATTDLRTNVETTYSAPFAAYGHSRETVRNRGTVREYPRLRHGGSHLRNPLDRHYDILRRGFIGAAQGIAIFVSMLVAVNIARGRGVTRPWLQLRESGWGMQWKVVAAICIGSGMAMALAPFYHVFGTDQVGRDVLYLTLKSVRTGLVLGTVSTLIALPIAITLGIAAGYLGGWVDDAVQFLYTTLSSIPGVLLIAAAALSLDVFLEQRASAFVSLTTRADMKLLALCLVLGLTGWTGLCRVLRAEVLKLRTVEFVTAAHALGATPLRIFHRHLLPNTFHLVIITAVIDFSGLVLAEAVLTYIDIGVDPSMESWGNLINGARLELAREPVVWWSLVAAFIGMFGLVLAANVFADAVRDAFDPRLRGLPSPIAIH